MRRTTGLLLLFSVLPAWAGPVDDATALMDRGEHRQAAELLLEATEHSPATAEALILITRALANAGDWEEAVDWGKRAIDAAPEHSAAHLEYARAIRVKMQSVNKISAMMSIGAYKKELARALELDPRNVEAHEEQIGFLIYAPRIAGGDKKIAGQQIAELKALDWRAGMWMQADLLKENEDAAGVIANYEEMLARDGEDHVAREALAYAQQQAGRYREADRHFAVLLEAGEPQRAQGARYQLARSRILGEYEADQAVAYLRQYIERLGGDRRGLPSESNAYWRLGLAYQQLDRVADARRALERAVTLDRSNKEARAALKRLPRG